MLVARPYLQKGQALFTYSVNGQFIPLTYEILSKKLKEWVTGTGKQGDQYTLHGLRHSGTNHALMVGICGEDLQLLGDWRSQAYMEYIDLNMDCKYSNMVKFVQAVDQKVADMGWSAQDEPGAKW